jgi:flavin reductase (DIM6/NTAB) family NADH-FMN oxidoreductase RutF
MTAVDAWRFRQAMGRFATGVTVVTTVDPDTGDAHGMTANSFLSVSLDPPLVLVALGRCRMADLLPAAGRYGVSVLTEQQQEIASHFANAGTANIEPEFVWHDGLPFLAGALAMVGCTLEQIHPAGDHCLAIGNVDRLSYGDGHPLIFYTGTYGVLNVGLSDDSFFL